MGLHSTRNAVTPVLHAATNPYKAGVGRGVLAALLSVVLMVGSTGWFVYDDLLTDVKSNALDTSGLGDTSTTDSQNEEAPADSFEGRAVNVLIAGIDSRYDQGDAANGNSEELSTIQSDTTMVAHISADRSRVQIVSIPRDTLTNVPSCKRTDGSVSEAYYGMFNSAFATGAVTDDVASGIACTKSTVEKMTGLNIDGFFVVDFKGFEAMINALGGVWFTVDEDVNDPEADLVLSAGCQKLDGTSALGYARARYSLGDGSDISRIGRQQKLVAAIMREALGKNFVTDLPSLLSFLKQALGSLQTSTNLSDLNTDAGLLLSLSSIDRANIQFVTMPNKPAPTNANRVVAIEPAASNVWQALASDSALPVSTEYTDGSGTAQTIPDPATAAAETGTGTNGASSSESSSTEDATGTSGSTSTPESSTTEQCPPQSASSTSSTGSAPTGDRLEDGNPIG